MSELLDHALCALLPGLAELARLRGLEGVLAWSFWLFAEELCGLGRGAGGALDCRSELCRLACGLGRKLPLGRPDASDVLGWSNLARSAATLEADPVLTSGGGPGLSGSEEGMGGCRTLAGASSDHQPAVQWLLVGGP